MHTLGNGTNTSPVEQATFDADTFVSTALELADSGEAVVLVGTALPPTSSAARQHSLWTYL